MEYSSKTLSKSIAVYNNAGKVESVKSLSSLTIS